MSENNNPLTILKGMSDAFIGKSIPQRIAFIITALILTSTIALGAIALLLATGVALPTLLIAIAAIAVGTIVFSLALHIFLQLDKIPGPAKAILSTGVGIGISIAIITFLPLIAGVSPIIALAAATAIMLSTFSRLLYAALTSKVVTDMWDKLLDKISGSGVSNTTTWTKFDTLYLIIAAITVLTTIAAVGFVVFYSIGLITGGVTLSAVVTPAVLVATLPTAAAQGLTVTGAALALPVGALPLGAVIGIVLAAILVIGAIVLVATKTNFFGNMGELIISFFDNSEKSIDNDKIPLLDLVNKNKKGFQQATKEELAQYEKEEEEDINVNGPKPADDLSNKDQSENDKIEEDEIQDLPSDDDNKTEEVKKPNQQL